MNNDVSPLNAGFTRHKRTCVLVLGMHRSGTSALTRVISLLGARLPAKLMAASEHNVRGHWEPASLAEVHEAMLSEAGSSWNDWRKLDLATALPKARFDHYRASIRSIVNEEYADAPLFVLKEPRICRFVPFYREVLEDMGVTVRPLLIWRNPLEVMSSLSARDGFSREQGQLYWLRHVLDSERGTRDLPRGLLTYESLLTTWREAVETAVEPLDIAWPASLDSITRDVESFLAPELRHHTLRMPDSQADDMLDRWLRRVTEALDGMASAPGRSIATLDAVSDEFEPVSALFGSAVAAEKAIFQQGLDAQRAIHDVAMKAEKENAELALTAVREAMEASLEAEKVKAELTLAAVREAMEASLEAEKDKAELALAAVREAMEESLEAERAKAELSIIAQRQALEELQAERQELILARARAEDLEISIQDYKNSSSWRLTAPIRAVTSRLKRSISWIKQIQMIVTDSGGIFGTYHKLTNLYRREGVQGLRGRIRLVSSYQMRRAAFAGVGYGGHTEFDPRTRSVPYFLNDEQFVEGTAAPTSVAIHLHCHYVEEALDILTRIARSNIQADLFISVSTEALKEQIESFGIASLPGKRMVIEIVDNIGRDLYPLICVFARDLKQYDIVGHFHTKRSPHNGYLSAWGKNIYDILLGGVDEPQDGHRIRRILNLLTTGDAKLVCAEPPAGILPDPTGWGGNKHLATYIWQTLAGFKGILPDRVDFPEGSMFWARREAVEALLSLPISINNFDAEPLPPDGTFAHALERLIFQLAAGAPGRILRIYRDRYPLENPYWEQQKQYTVPEDAPKVLAYYLPQFHPTPENDEWHGEGFTEWTKVRSTQPLFSGHGQQRVPHQDIGYYLIDGPETLEMQAKLMTESGVYGLIFYHYWFSGKLILDKPARTLLSNPSIAMNYCFCWANENWTRRWDGSEQDILLGQTYSEDDAREFIEHIIPFMRDERYITYDGRPIIFVYRPALIPEATPYVRIWKEVTRAAGLPEPIVIGTLKDGLHDVSSREMDAAVERPLHDWTGGAVSPISQRLEFYGPEVDGILDYPQVVDHYCQQTFDGRIPTIRCALPGFDNTPRYGIRAHCVHNPNPEDFERWISHLVGEAKLRPGIDGEFLVVNAWNEWAETAMVEPDRSFGYSYLNAIGRALGGKVRDTDAVVRSAVVETKLQVHIRIPTVLDDELTQGGRRAEVFLRCLELTMRKNAQFDYRSDGANLSKLLAGLVSYSQQTEVRKSLYIVDVRDLCLFQPHSLRAMIGLSADNPDEEIIPVFHADPAVPPHSVPTRMGRVLAKDAYFSPLIISNGAQPARGARLFRQCPEAFVTTLVEDIRPPFSHIDCILRYHRGGGLWLLERALGSLAAQRDVSVNPIIMTQDLSEDELDELKDLVASIPWRESSRPEVKNLRSSEAVSDLRTVLLREGLLRSSSRYVAFLDYDDLLFPDAYARIVERLSKTGKAVSFGRVFRAYTADRHGPIIRRDRVYEYNKNYNDFLNVNHAPIHSFVLERDKIDINSLIFYEDHKYMEDYFMLLQIVNGENTDWASLSENIYIGDYIHFGGSLHGTLAVVSEDARQRVTSSEDFRRDERRVKELVEAKRRHEEAKAA